MTFTVTDVVCVRPPPVAVTVSVCAPTEALCPTVMLSVEVPEPPASEVGESLPVTPPPPPDIESDTLALKPPEPATLIAVEPDPPRFTVIEAGEDETEKSPFWTGAFTVSDTVVLCTVLPLVPVSVTL